MRAGELRHRLELQSRASSPEDSYGQQADDWVTIRTVWAAVRPLGVVERSEAAKNIGEVTHLVTMRGGVASVKPNMRFRWKDRLNKTTRLLEVVGTMDYDERGVELRITCKEKV